MDLPVIKENVQLRIFLLQLPQLGQSGKGLDALGQLNAENVPVLDLTIPIF